MNPSSQGWVSKYGITLANQHYFNSHGELYNYLRTLGFIYGVNVSFPTQIVASHTFSPDEMAKTNLLFALHQTFLIEKGKTSFSDFLQTANQFYTALEIQSVKDTFSENEKKIALQLEKNIARRVHLDTNILTKNFSNLLINALLYVDILLFVKFLKKNNKNLLKTASKIEKSLLHIVSQTLQMKTEKSAYDRNLIALFTASASRWKDDGSLKIPDTALLRHKFNRCTLRYFVDMSALAAWNNQKIEPAEKDYIQKITSQFGLPENTATQAIAFLIDFFQTHQKKIYISKSSNYVQNFYENTTQFVYRLVIRNKKRIVDELIQNKELVVLLTKSATEELSADEKQKVRKQLVDLCKVIPSLAIFILPGGSLLLPIFIKLIPGILPASFDDNRT
ncbi:MAG: LETM1-related biofilm-associated protein [Capnocytophaga sp.]|nr:LETM1-related biofilm-associated protein [Capnocytophaga sp.]